MTVVGAFLLIVAVVSGETVRTLASKKQTVRFATFNASLNRNSAGQLISDLSSPTNSQAKNVAEIIQRVRPDVLLINEFDYDEAGQALTLFQTNYLGVSQNGQDPIAYQEALAIPSNTGIPSGQDFCNGCGFSPNNAFGFGFFAGQYGFAVLSKYPIDMDAMRTFQQFLWKDMPSGLYDIVVPGTMDTPWFSSEALNAYRLSSKNHVDVPIQVRGDQTIHFLASHPTPPVFDGEEDLNGRRNHDEIRFWADYINPGATSRYIYDDNNNYGGLRAGARFVIAGDMNADPFDGDSRDFAIQQILNSPFTNTKATPTSAGGVDATQRQAGVNLKHVGGPAQDTADFGFAGVGVPDVEPGNLRVDYVLPSKSLKIDNAAVFWQPSIDPIYPLAEFPTSDHRLVWVDLVV